MMACIRLLAMVGCVATLATPVAGATFADVLAGTLAPITVKLQDLDKGWRRIQTCEQLNNSERLFVAVYEMYLGRSNNTLYTRGQVVKLGSDQYLLVYQPLIQPIDMAHMLDGNPPAADPLTPESELALGLLRMRDLAGITDIQPFNLRQELLADKRRRTLKMSNGDQSKFEQLRADLATIRTAIETFHDDTGAYPARLADLLAPADEAPTTGVDADGNTVALQHYNGPYLDPVGGIAEAPGIPCNPILDPENTITDTALVETHWYYSNGNVSVPEYMAGQITTDGKLLGEY